MQQQKIHPPPSATLGSTYTQQWVGFGCRWLPDSPWGGVALASARFQVQKVGHTAAGFIHSFIYYYYF